MTQYKSQQDLQQQWESSMTRQIEDLRSSIQLHKLEQVADRCGGRIGEDKIVLKYWNRSVEVSWPDLKAFEEGEIVELGLFDTTLLLYYLKTADGSPLADRWISFRELPGGAFYHQAFQGYSGDQMAKIFEPNLEDFHLAAKALRGVRLTGLGEYAYAFQPLPRIRLAALLWPGDDEFPSRGSVLFDAGDIHYMVLDGLAILGSRLVRNLEKSVR